MGESAIQSLLDRAAISDVVHAYATGLDRRDWPLFRSIFLDTIKMNFESVGLRSGSYDADRWVADARRLFAGFKATFKWRCRLFVGCGLLMRRSAEPPRERR